MAQSGFGPKQRTRTTLSHCWMVSLLVKSTQAFLNHSVIPELLIIPLREMEEFQGNRLPNVLSPAEKLYLPYLWSPINISLLSGPIKHS